MSNSITAAFVQQWDSSIRAAAQQSESRLMKAVTDRGVIAGDGYTINNMGTTELDENTVRHGDTMWGDVDHTNRLATMKNFYKALPLDRNDIPKMIVNPVTGGDYMRALINARNRKADSVIYTALGATINSRDGVTANVLPAGQKIAHEIDRYRIGNPARIGHCVFLQTLDIDHVDDADGCAGIDVIDRAATITWVSGAIELEDVERRFPQLCNSLSIELVGIRCGDHDRRDRRYHGAVCDMAQADQRA